MKVQKFRDQYYIIRIEPGEPLMAKLTEFVRSEKIGFA
jgi:predicted DNA-binding protein with PD1-like motif